MNTYMMSVDEVSDVLAVSKGKAYIIIRRLNEELDKEGYITVAGKIPRKFLSTKLFGGVGIESEVMKNEKC